MGHCDSARYITLKVDAKVKANMSGVSSKVSRISKDSGLGTFLASEAARGMDKFVPMRTGALAASVRPSAFKVSYGMPYARYAYYGQGKRFTTDKHPNATAYWDRAYVAAGGARQLGEAGTNYLKGR